jgi:hypothetical protein
MLKSLAIFGLLLVLAPMVPGQPNKAAEQKQESAKQSQPAVLSTDSPNKQDSSQTDQPKPGSNSPAGNTAVERPKYGGEIPTGIWLWLPSLQPA